MLNEHLIVKTRPLAAKENVLLWKNYRVTVLVKKRRNKSENNISK